MMAIFEFLPGVGDHLKTAFYRHGNVGNDDVRLQFSDLFFTYCPILCLAHHRAAALLPRYRVANALADDLFIFYQ